MSEKEYHAAAFRAAFGPSRHDPEKLSLAVTDNGYQWTSLTQSADDWRLILGAIQDVLSGHWVSRTAKYDEPQEQSNG